MQQPEQFDQFALVELLGRQRLAGKVTERVIAGAGFLQVDVPETSHSPKFTRFIAPSAIYAINPLDEATTKAYAESLRVKPIDTWDISAFMKKVEEQKMLRPVIPSFEQIEKEKEENLFDEQGLERDEE